MAPVGCEDLLRFQPLGDCHNRRVHEADSEIVILSHQLRGSVQIFALERNRRELARYYRTDKIQLRLRAKPRTQEIADFSQRRLGNQDLFPIDREPVHDR